jgi:hypothetical protein
LPEASAVVVLFAAPLSVSVAPAPDVTVPDMVHVAGICVAVKFTAPTFPPLTVTARLDGEMVKPDFAAATL